MFERIGPDTLSHCDAPSSFTVMSMPRYLYTATFSSSVPLSISMGALVDLLGGGSEGFTLTCVKAHQVVVAPVLDAVDHRLCEVCSRVTADDLTDDVVGVLFNAGARL